MTTTITARPTDELTARVVAKMLGIEMTWAWSGDRGLSSFVKDPREDTDVALEILNALFSRGLLGRGIDEPVMIGDVDWEIHDCPEEGTVLGHAVYEFPASGPGFRNAVVNIAARVMGVER